MTRRALGLMLAASLAMCSALRGQSSAESRTSLRLVRCGQPLASGCLEAPLVLPLRPDPAHIGVAALRDSAAWSLELGGVSYPTVVVPTSPLQPPLRVMVLLDVSGSMAGQGMAFTRAALGEFLGNLDTGGVEVALAPFESRAVASRIKSAAFGAPGTAAVTLRQLPPPDRKGNTALYSAVTDGLAALDAAVAAAPGAFGALIVVTDGRNDVSGAGDDPGLLTGEAGVRAAATGIGNSTHSVWVIGAGDLVAESELKNLAGSSGEPYIVKMDPVAMSERLRAIAKQLQYTRRVVAYAGVGARSLLAQDASGELRLRGAGDSLPVGQVSWRPPLIALPAYQHLARSAAPVLMTVARKGAAAELPVWLSVLSIGLLTAALWWIVPFIAWRAPVSATAPAVPAPTATRRVAAEQPAAVAQPTSTSVAPGKVRPDVREAPPRSPADITNQSARRLER